MCALPRRFAEGYFEARSPADYSMNFGGSGGFCRRAEDRFRSPAMRSSAVGSQPPPRQYRPVALHRPPRRQLSSDRGVPIASLAAAALPTPAGVLHSTPRSLGTLMAPPRAEAPLGLRAARAGARETRKQAACLNIISLSRGYSAPPKRSHPAAEPALTLSHRLSCLDTTSFVDTAASLNFVSLSMASRDQLEQHQAKDGELAGPARAPRPHDSPTSLTASPPPTLLEQGSPSASGRRGGGRSRSTLESPRPDCSRCAAR